MRDSYLSWMILRQVSEVLRKSFRLSLVTIIPSVFSARWSRNLSKAKIGIFQHFQHFTPDVTECCRLVPSLATGGWTSPLIMVLGDFYVLISSSCQFSRCVYLSSCEDILLPQTSRDGVKESSRRSSSWFRKCCSATITSGLSYNRISKTISALNALLFQYKRNVGNHIGDFEIFKLNKRVINKDKWAVKMIVYNFYQYKYKVNTVWTQYDLSQRSSCEK